MVKPTTLDDLIVPGAEHTQVVDGILSNRSALGDVLFFDRLLKTVGIDNSSKYYPARSATDIQKLLSRIQDSKSPIHHQQSLVYYVLKDLDIGGPFPSSKKSSRSHKTPRHVTYFNLIHLPQKYATLMDGLWHLDRQEFEASLRNLTSPSLIPTFTEETLMVLAENPRSKPAYVLAYYHAVAPDLQNGPVLDAVFGCMVQASVTEAFFFARQQGGSLHRHLYEQLLYLVIGAKASEEKAQMAEELVGLPFNADEFDWFQRYLTNAGLKVPGSQDILVMRMLLVGKVDTAEALLDRTDDRQVNGLSWRTLLQSADA